MENLGALVTGIMSRPAVLFSSNFVLTKLEPKQDTNLILQIPDTIPVCEFLKCCATLGQDTAFKTTHVKQKIWIVFAVHRHKAFIPVQCGHRSWQTIFYVPEHSTPKVDVMLHESHTSISWPAFPVVVSHYVFIIRIWMLCEVTLDQISSFISCKPLRNKDQFSNTVSGNYTIAVIGDWLKNLTSCFSTKEKQNQN